MQGNKKQTDGQSDSSSIGSLLDDTDREVCSLTDRAFRSLCVAELETFKTESDPAAPFNIHHQFSSKFFQGPQNYTIKENTVSHKQLSKSEEHSTFQQFPKDSQENKKASTNIRKNLGFPVPGLCSYKRTSKVSSLIKTFDKVENEASLALAKHPDKNSLKRGPLIFGQNVTFLGGKTILNIQKELSEFSDTSQYVANGKHELHKRHSKMDLICQGPYSFYFSQADASKSKISAASKMPVKNRIEKAKEPARKGRFLHSENSAFESWNAHHKKMSEMNSAAEIISKEENLKYFVETPFLEESSISKHTVSSHDIAVSGTLEQDFSDALSEKSEVSPSSVALPQIFLPEDEDTVSQILSPQVSAPLPPVCKTPTPPSLTSEDPFPPKLTPQIDALPVPLSKVPISPSLSQISVPPAMASHSTDTQMLVPHVTLLPKKANSSELEKVCPPWRKQKLIPVERVQEAVQDIESEMPPKKDSSYRKVTDLTLLTEAAALPMSVPSTSSFNISTLSTPNIPHEKNEAESQLLPVTPPISATGAAKETEEKNLYCSQNNYKSKAPSLLFNLKDIRKRVKSTYSASPLQRALEDKRKIKEQDNLKASVEPVSVLQEGSQNSVDSSEKDYHLSEQMDNTQENSIAINLNGNDLTPAEPKSKADSLNYQNRNNLRQPTLMDIEDCKVISVTALHTTKHGLRQYSPSPNCFLGDVTTEQDVYLKSFYLQDSKNEKGAQCHSSDMGPHASPNLFFLAEENMINNDSQTCPLTRNEQKGKRSASSSEQSFISITEQPSNEMNCSLMQLFQKACLQESQRKKSDMSVEEKPDSKEKEMIERKKEFHDYLFSNYNSNMDRKCERKKEENENGNAVQERVAKEKEEDRWKTMNSAEGKSEEPLTPTSSNSFKPNLFMIKDNTFKSSPVTKAIKLPLLRSFSCEDFIAGSHSETEKQSYGPMQAIMNSQEVDMSFSRLRTPQKVEEAQTDRNTDESSSVSLKVDCQVDENSNPTAEHTEGLRRIASLVEYDDNDGANSTSVLSVKDLENSDKLDKEKIRAGELKLSSASQPNLTSDVEVAQNKLASSTREKTNYFKNRLFSKRRGGSCVKKIISRETKSPIVSENPISSPVPSDTIEDVSAAIGSLSNSTLPSPRSDSMVTSAFTSPSTGTVAIFSVSQDEKIVKASVLHKAAESRDQSSAMETFNPIQRSQHSEDASYSPVTNGKSQLMGRMAKTAAKPPAVPPKTEKALRRAKKLANRRKKAEAQQKRLHDEPTPHCGDTAHLSPLSLTCPSSPLTPSESNLVRQQPTISLSPTPSLPETQRKLLQDPDSGEYFIIDLPIQLKTFYDPESGRYVQLSIPSSKRNLSQTPTSEIPSSSYVLYPSALPLRVSSVPVLASPSQLSEPASSVQGTRLNPASDWQLVGQRPDDQCCDAHGQETDGSQCNFEKDVDLSANADIISVGAIEDFVVEGIS